MDWMELNGMWEIKNIIRKDGMMIQLLKNPKQRHYKFKYPDGSLFSGFLSRKNIKKIEPGLYPLITWSWFIERELILFAEDGKIYIIHEYRPEFLEICKENSKRTVNKMKYEDILGFFLI